MEDAKDTEVPAKAEDERNGHDVLTQCARCFEVALWMQIGTLELRFKRMVLQRPWRVRGHCGERGWAVAARLTRAKVP